MNGIKDYVTKLHVNAIICSLALTYLSTLLILNGDRCAGASLAASIATLAIAFANQNGNGNGQEKSEPMESARSVVGSTMNQEQVPTAAQLPKR